MNRLLLTLKIHYLFHFLFFPSYTMSGSYTVSIDVFYPIISLKYLDSVKSYHKALMNSTHHSSLPSKTVEVGLPTTTGEFYRMLIFLPSTRAVNQGGRTISASHCPVVLFTIHNIYVSYTHTVNPTRHNVAHSEGVRTDRGIVQSSIVCEYENTYVLDTNRMSEGTKWEGWAWRFFCLCVSLRLYYWFACPSHPRNGKQSIAKQSTPNPAMAAAPPTPL